MCGTRECVPLCLQLSDLLTKLRNPNLRLNERPRLVILMAFKQFLAFPLCNVDNLFDLFQQDLKRHTHFVRVHDLSPF